MISHIHNKYVKGKYCSKVKCTHTQNMLCYVPICMTDLSQYSVSIIQLDRGPLWAFYKYKHTITIQMNAQLLGDHHL